MAHLRTAFGDMYSSCIYRTAVTAPLRCGIRTGRNLEAFYRTYSSHTRECSSLGMLLPTPHKTLYQQRYFTTEGEVKNPSASAASTTPTGEVFAFKAETSRLLEIVAHSLYVDREIFIRELISNASDALEKLRFLENTAQVTLSDSDIPLKIMISTDDKEKLFIIEDTGIGMDKQEMIENLGTIAKSGSLEFLENSSLSAKDKANAIIGKFGVGFYSSFVVANEVQVFTCSFDPQRGNIGWHWISDGLGSFSIQECADLPRGTKIVLKLKEECYDFCNSKIVEKCAEKFSSFVSYPLYMKEGETEKKINIQEAVWLKDTITEEEHQQFFRYLNGTSYGDPMMTLSFRSDAPLSIKSLFYIPEDPPSRMFQTKHEVGVSLHSRRVLVKKSADDIIPKWLFFIKGVVDCEDMPLNVSRENMQDLRLIEKLSMTLVKRILRFFEDQ
ncbi:putative heat shock protein 75, partial [Cardiosporidium cionae]